MLIDCDDCVMQGTDACHDCVVTFLLADVAGPLELDAERTEALDVLADAGLVPKLRLIPKAANG